MDYGYLAVAALMLLAGFLFAWEQLTEQLIEKAATRKLLKIEGKSYLLVRVDAEEVQK